MRNHQRVPLKAKPPQILHVGRVKQRLIIFRKYDALVSVAIRMPFESQKRAELAVIVRVSDDPLHARPRFLESMKTIDEVPRTPPVVTEIVPAGVSGKREEIEMPTGDVDTALDRPPAIAVRVVIVNVAEDEPQLLRHDARNSRSWAGDRLCDFGRRYEPAELALHELRKVHRRAVFKVRADDLHADRQSGFRTVDGRYGRG